MPRSPQRSTAAVLSAAAIGYVLLTCILIWPLPLHLHTHLTGDPGGDTGVYVWNLWVFSHELIEHARLPFSTDHVFAYTDGADFSLHNYTPIAGMLATPLIGTLGVVATFNVVLLVFIALSGLGVFVLARRLGLGAVAAWSAGALFIASPVIIAKETAHFSLVIAASLPLFLWALLRTLDSGRLRDAILVGVIVAAASYSDAYYGIYCVMMGVFLIVSRFTRLEWRGRATEWPRLVTMLNVVIVVAGGLIGWRALSGTTGFSIGPVRIGLQTLYTPVLALTLAVAFRTWLAWRPVLRRQNPTEDLARLVGLGFVAVAVCLVLLLPQLVGIAIGFVNNRLPETELFWRSSPRGIDALAYFVPNPNHPWFGEQTRRWFMPANRPDAFPEFVGSFSLVAFAVLAAAWLRVLPRFWLAFTAFFAWLSLGPFIHIAGVNTYVPGLWAFLRFVPVIGMARSPTRFAIVAVLGLSLLFGFALDALFRRQATKRLVRGWAIAVALVIELLPVPRTLHAAAVPEVYALVAAKGDESGRLLELPGGVRDGTSSFGDFSPATEYFQTQHERPLIGGYLSRVSRWRREENQRVPMLRALFAASEGINVSPAWRDEARASRDAFLRRSCVRFVVVNKSRSPEGLREFAVDALGLALVHEDAGYALFTPVDPPACGR